MRLRQGVHSQRSPAVSNTYQILLLMNCPITSKWIVRRVFYADTRLIAEISTSVTVTVLQNPCPFILAQLDSFSTKNQTTAYVLTKRLPALQIATLSNPLHLTNIFKEFSYHYQTRLPNSLNQQKSQTKADNIQKVANLIRKTNVKAKMLTTTPNVSTLP